MGPRQAARDTKHEARGTKMSQESRREDLGRKHQFHGVQPVLPVGDVARSAEYFRDVLGFEIEFLEGDPLPYPSRGGSGSSPCASSMATS